MGHEVDATVVGARIRERRIELGLTQEQVGNPRLTGGYISLIECGRRNPSDEVLQFIAQRLRLEVDELIRGTPPGLQADLELRLHAAIRSVDRGASEEASEIAAQVRDIARHHQLTRIEARSEETLARISERANPAIALDHYRRAEELWEGEPLHLRVGAITGTAHCTRLLGDTQMAVHCLDTYRRDLIQTNEPHPHALARTYTELVYAYFAVGLPQKAREAAQQALRLEGDIDDPDEVACMHLTVARTLLHTRRFSDALVSVRRAHEIYSAGGWRNKAAKALIAEGIVLSKKNDYEVARERLLSALTMLDESPNDLDMVLALNELGRVSRHLGDTHSALGYLQRAQPLLDKGDLLERAFNEREMGSCLADVDPGQAEVHLQRAVDLYRVAGATDEIATTCKWLGDMYVSLGQTDRALATLREGLEYVEQRSSE